LSTGLVGGEVLNGSVNGGTTWTDITAKVTGTAISWDGATLAGSSSIQFKVTDAAANDGDVAIQTYVLDTTSTATSFPGAPTIPGTSGQGAIINEIILPPPPPPPAPPAASTAPPPAQVVEAIMEFVTTQPLQQLSDTTRTLLFTEGSIPPIGEVTQVIRNTIQSMSVGEVKQLIESLIENDDLELDEFSLGEVHPLASASDLVPDDGGEAEYTPEDWDGHLAEGQKQPSAEQEILAAVEELSMVQRGGAPQLSERDAPTGAPSFTQQLYAANRFEVERNTLVNAVKGSVGS
ncbi:MAG: hypothetical protein GY731_06825, partial [Gammaproteobacteria bacterium]|nr:hypothetical protein [Gammaproteobacteria bacterium]